MLPNEGCTAEALRDHIDNLQTARSLSDPLFQVPWEWSLGVCILKRSPFPPLRPNPGDFDEGFWLRASALNQSQALAWLTISWRSY